MSSSALSVPTLTSLMLASRFRCAAAFSGRSLIRFLPRGLALRGTLDARVTLDLLAREEFAGGVGDIDCDAHAQSFEDLKELAPVDAFGTFLDLAEKTLAYADTAGGIVLPEALRLARGAD